MTLLDRLAAHAAQQPEAPALMTPGRLPLTYAALWALVQRAAARYNELGVGRGDHVALVLPSGPEMAAALVSTLACATVAPLNPTYTPAEFEYLLTNLQARALVVLQGGEGPVVQVARALGVAVLELVPDLEAPAGTFALHGQARSLRGPGSFSQSDDIALVNFTSGTTGRPKRVPMPLSTLSIAAGHYAASVELTPADRCLSIMPLFHAHGLMATLLGTLTTGASVICTPGFLAARFFDWMIEERPTWYSAVPALHQSVLARAAEVPELLARIQPLRVIRSASATLPVAVLAELERVFGAPVVQGYGITETNLVASTRPKQHKAGSVGLPAGYEIGIMRPGSAERLPQGATGEIVLRGPSLFPGYADDPEANARAFTEGWFRTGDQGYVDEDGYLFITGRIKELISRGAEMVAPVEVEEALLAHPGVAEAVVFGIPDARLGETVGAAVVARPGAALDEPSLRRFVAQSLSFYKVPRRVVVLDALPRTPVGKVPRLGMAAHLGLTTGAEADVRPGPAPYAPPETALEKQLADLWQTVLMRPRVGRHDRFIDLGGDSLLAGQLVGRVAATLSLELTLLDFFDAPTVAQQAALLEHLISPHSNEWASVLDQTQEFGSL